MPNYKKNHNENRVKVCAVCFDKSKHVLPINISQEAILQKIIPGFRLSSKYFPSGICACCRQLMVKHGENLVTSTTIFNYQANRILISGKEACSCLICTVARLQLKERNVYCTKKQERKAEPQKY